ncbi:MAG: depupylase/deamidase Dop [Acidimicrobiia bacterium]|nr:depupylase/deamidase Dop [Acidimicrobiia bacterium]
MALRKILGVETEYGILLRGRVDANPIAASSLLINAYISSLGDSGAASSTPRVGWDFVDENPAQDARGTNLFASIAPEIETHLVNAVLTNGARYYVDHAHPEMSSPECADARSVVVYDRAGDLILADSMAAAARLLNDGEEILIVKNNSDRKGNSYGCHENYLMDRTTPFSRVVANVMPHFVTRQIYTGAGKVGTEALNMSSAEVPYQLTQRADFFEEEVGLETTLKRPLVNTRDEPHADPKKYRRLHVITGDANMSEVATFLKVGVTAILLCMVEDEMVPDIAPLANPVQAMRQVSYDLTLRRPLELENGRSITALEWQWELFDVAKKYAEVRGLEAVDEAVGADVMDRWEQILTGLEADPMSLADQLDWVAKYRVVDGLRERKGLDWGDARLALIDLQYHDLRPEKSVAAKVGLQRITTDEEVLRAKSEPPDDTRAYFRGRCLQKWSDDIVAANWDSMVFDIGDDPLRRVPMMEPTRGTRSHVGTLLDECETSAELLKKLGA